MFKGQLSHLKLLPGGCKWLYSFSLSQQRHGNQLAGVEITRKMSHGLAGAEIPIFREQNRESNRKHSLISPNYFGGDDI